MKLTLITISIKGHYYHHITSKVGKSVLALVPCLHVG